MTSFEEDTTSEWLSLTDLPSILPILPLNGGVLLPHARLSLNLEDESHKELIDEALRSERFW